MHHVILGGGIAGTTAADELRKKDPYADITLVSEEEHALYSRVLLPHYIKGKVSRERVFLKKESWYGEQKIEWIRGVSAASLHPTNRIVELTNGRELSYDALLIATGGEVKFLPEDVRGVSYCRTLDDADHLCELLQGGANRAMIFGGGFIACEYLNIFAARNIPTTVAFQGDHFWSHTFSKEAGALLNNHLRTHHVEIIPQAAFTSLRGEKQLEAVETNQGIHPCSIVGIGIGIDSNFAFVRDAGIEVNKGIVCDAFLRTNREHVFTAGDVAEYFDDRIGCHVRAGNWMNALMQGRHVAKSMMGERQSFDLVSSYATNALGLDIIFVGDTSREDADETRQIGSLEKKGITEIFVRNHQLVGAILVGRNEDRAIVTKLIQQKSHPNEFEKIVKNS